MEKCDMKILILFIFSLIMFLAAIVVYEDVQETHFKQVDTKCPVISSIEISGDEVDTKCP